MLKNGMSGNVPPVALSSTWIAVGPWTWKRKSLRRPVGLAAVRSSRSTLTS